MKQLVEHLDDVTSGDEEITPETAAEMLKDNIDNRSFRRRLAEAYARDMAEGRWHYTGDPIKFAVDGTLLDGQHRLAAIVRSGVAIRFKVVRGLEKVVRDVVDTGAIRTSADVVKFHGEQNGTTLAAVARLILTEGDTVTLRITNAELIELIEEDPHLRWVVSKGITPLGGLREVITPGPLGYLYWRLHRVDPFACAEFFTKLATLEELSAGSPILALRRQLGLIADRNKSRAKNYRQEVITAVFVAWNAWRKGETRTTIRVAKYEGRLNIPEPI